MLPTFGSVLSPGLVSYHLSTRVASRQPSSFSSPSMTIFPAARVIGMRSPDSAVCAAAAECADQPRAGEWYDGGDIGDAEVGRRRLGAQVRRVSRNEPEQLVEDCG